MPNHKKHKIKSSKSKPIEQTNANQLSPYLKHICRLFNALFGIYRPNQATYNFKLQIDDFQNPLILRKKILRQLRKYLPEKALKQQLVARHKTEDQLFITDLIQACSKRSIQAPSISPLVLQNLIRGFNRFLYFLGLNTNFLKQSNLFQGDVIKAVQYIVGFELTHRLPVEELKRRAKAFETIIYFLGDTAPTFGNGKDLLRVQFVAEEDTEEAATDLSLFQVKYRRIDAEQQEQARDLAKVFRIPTTKINDGESEAKLSPSSDPDSSAEALSPAFGAFPSLEQLDLNSSSPQKTLISPPPVLPISMFPRRTTSHLLGKRLSGFYTSISLPESTEQTNPTGVDDEDESDGIEYNI